MLSFFLPRCTINNRDKGFIVAREIVAIKVSGCFQSVNSRCRKVEARQRPPSYPRRSFSLRAADSLFSSVADIDGDGVYLWVHVCYIHSHCSLAITVLEASLAGTRCRYVRKNVTPLVAVPFSKLSDLFDFHDYVT